VTDTIQHDNFAEDAAAVRQAVIAGKFETHQGPDGAMYTGISTYPVLHWHAFIEKVVGHHIVPKMSFFRLNLAGEIPHSWVHSDDICAQYASVLYLNTPEQCSGGTAFWAHTALKIDRLPTREQLAKQGVNADWFYRMMDREWKDLTFWKQTGMVEMKWNRFVTYPTCLFHSRFPFEPFGKGPEDGRLIWVCFYDKES
jgi:hypothetical protein